MTDNIADRRRHPAEPADPDHRRRVAEALDEPAHADGEGQIRPALICSAAGQGCAGTATAKLDGQSLGTRTYAIAAGKESALQFTLNRAQLHSGGTLLVSITPVIGTASKPSSAVPVTAG